MLRNFAKRIVLAYDADAAGQSATSRVYEWERKHEVDVVVAALPGGSDPGDLARTDPEALSPRRARSPALPPVPGGRACSAPGNLATAEGRARAAEAALMAVAEHPDDLVRDQYVMQLADRCRLDADKLREHLEHLRAHPPVERRGAARGRPGHGRTSHRARTPATTSISTAHWAARGRRRGHRRGQDAPAPGSKRSSWPSIVPKKQLIECTRSSSQIQCNVAPSSRSWSTTACTMPSRPRHRRWRTCCDAS